MRRRIDAVNTAIGLLTESVRDRWLNTLATMIDRTDVHGLLLGRIVRLLLDAERLSNVSLRLQRALSAGVPAADKAAWVDGFFSDGALLLIHDAVRGLRSTTGCASSTRPSSSIRCRCYGGPSLFVAAERQVSPNRVARGARESRSAAA
jgi:hypothetical protein